jgi:hypothetical protein
MNEENRTKKWRERGRKEGKKQVNVMLDPEGAEALENLQEALPGWSYARIISRALVLAEEDPARLDTRMDHKVKGSIERLEEEMHEVAQRLKTLEYRMAAMGGSQGDAGAGNPLVDGVSGPAREHPGEETLEAAWGGMDTESGATMEGMDETLEQDSSGPGAPSVAKPYVIPGEGYDDLPEDMDSLEEDDLGLFASSEDLPDKT